MTDECRLFVIYQRVIIIFPSFNVVVTGAVHISENTVSWKTNSGQWMTLLWKLWWFGDQFQFQFHLKMAP